MKYRATKDVSNLVIIGIKTRGITLAKRVTEKISALEKIKVQLVKWISHCYNVTTDISERRRPILNGTHIPFDIKETSRSRR